MITIQQVEGGFIVTYGNGGQQVVTSWRRLYAIVHDMFSPPREQIEQSNQ